MIEVLRLSELPSLRVDVACEPCGRRGSYSVARQFERLGNLSMPDFLTVVTADCKHRSGLGANRCGAYIPQLAKR